MIPRLLSRVRLEYWSPLQLFRVTHRGFFFLLLVLMIALSTFNTGNNLLVIVLSFLLAALLVSGMFSNLSLYGLRVHLQIPDSIHAQQKIILIFGLENFKRRIPSFSVTLKGDHSGTAQNEPDFFQTEKHFPFIGPRKTVTIPTPCTFEKRGVYPVDAFEVRTQFPFGFFSRGRKLDTLGQITIYPALIPYRELFRRQSALLGSEIWLRKGKGTGLYNIRDYQRGDDARFVSWKSTAKLSRLMVKEFLLEEEDFLQVVFSTYLPDPDSNALDQFEKVLSYLTTLSCLFLDLPLLQLEF
jgi:uncharacterized protein (DUF58 family)